MAQSATTLNTLQDFFSRVLPDDGVFVAVKNPANTKEFKQKPFKTHQDLANHLLGGGPQGGKANCYFALASYQQGWHEGPGGKMRLRTRENAAALKALWMDIDFKGGYEDAKAAVAAVAGFCRAVGMPAPTLVVGSGGGIHVYWTLSKAISAGEWDDLAGALKDAALRHGLKFDAMCTADRARILRAPFTRNHKTTPPRSVSILIDRAGDVSPDALRTALGQWVMPELGGKVPAALRAVTGAEEELGGGVGQEFPPSFMKLVVERCEVMKAQLSTGGKDSAEPLWNNTLLLSQFCEDGEEYAHRLSQGHPDYDKKETDYKFQQKKGAAKGPPSCKTFEAEMPDACAKCALRGRIKTPAQAGDQDFRMPGQLPRNWRYGVGGGMERGVPVQVEGKWEVEWQAVLPVAIKALRMGRDSGEIHELIFEVHWPGGDIQVIEIAGERLGSGTQFKTELGKKGLGFYGPEAENLLRLIMDWMKELKNSAMTDTLIDSFGWHGENFIAGETIYTPMGGVKHSIHRRVSGEASAFIPRGTLEKWRVVADQVKSNSVLETMIATSFAAPLVQYAAVNGAVVSLISDSGAGKTTALRTALSVWAHPVLGMSNSTDTKNRHTAKMALLRNLPIYYDELRGEKALADFSQLAFEIGQGRSKGRLTAGAEMREVAEWNTLVMVASNDSIADFLADEHGQTSAAVLRVFEFQIDDVPQYKTQLTDAHFLEENFATAGSVYADFLGRNQDKIRKLVSVETARLHKLWQFRSEERFWLAVCSTTMAGARIAKKLGILDFDLERVQQVLYDTLQRLRRSLLRKQVDDDPFDVVANFLIENIDHSLVTDIANTGAGHGRPKVEVYRVPRENASVRYQIALKEGIVRVNRRVFRQFLQERVRIRHPNKFTKKLEDTERVYPTKRYLGTGTQYATVQTYVLDFDLGMPAFKEIVKMLNSQIGNSAIT